jgi:hypothetical protein
MNNRFRWAVIAGALLFAVIVGAIAWNAGVSHGIAESGRIVAAPGGPYPYPYYGWHRPWGFGFFFIPLFFIAFWLLVVRGLFWHRRGYACGSRLDDWHTRAHERMGYGEHKGEREANDPDRR